MKPYISFDLKSLLIVFVCSIFSFGLFVLPETDLLAQEYEVDEVTYVSDEPCEEGEVDEVIHGERKGPLGCWGSDSTCKTKCK